MSASKGKAAEVSTSRRRWSKSEDDVLTNSVNHWIPERGKSIDWRRVAEQLPDRNNKDCRKRWLKIDNQWRQGQWAKAEDQALKQAVAHHGSHGKIRWKLISDMVQTRNPDQCAKRWRNALDPNIVRTRWDPAEDERLMAAVKAVGGRDWVEIEKQFFPGRSKLDLSNRYAMIAKRLQNARDRSSSIAAPSTTRSSSSSPDAESSSVSEASNEETDAEVKEEATEVNDWQEHNYQTVSYANHATTVVSHPSSTQAHQYHYAAAAPNVSTATWYQAHSHAGHQQQQQSMPSTAYAYYPQWPESWTGTSAAEASGSYHVAYSGQHAVQMSAYDHTLASNAHQQRHDMGPAVKEEE